MDSIIFGYQSYTLTLGNGVVSLILGLD